MEITCWRGKVSCTSCIFVHISFITFFLSLLYCIITSILLPRLETKQATYRKKKKKKERKKKLREVAFDSLPTWKSILCELIARLIRYVHNVKKIKWWWWWWWWCVGAFWVTLTCKATYAKKRRFGVIDCPFTLHLPSYATPPPSLIGNWLHILL